MNETAAPPVTVSNEESALKARVDSAVFDHRAVLTASFGFIDRAFVSLRKAEDHVEVVLAPKGDAPLPEALAAELVEALWAARLSGQLFASGREVIEQVTLRALGTPDGELLEIPPLTAEDLAAFEDPLGIAQSWEDKHAKKDPPEDG